MDTVSKSSMAVSMAALGGIAIVHYNNTPSDQYSIIRSAKSRRIPFASDPIFKSPSDFIDYGDDFASSPRAAGSSRYDFDQAASFLGQNAVDWTSLVSGEDGEVVDVFSVEDVERIRGFSKLGLPSTEAVHSTMEGFPSHMTGTSDLPDAQDGYGLMISELLGTYISNCSTVPAEIVGLHTDISLHNKTGILGDDDPIYLSLGEISITTSRLQELALSLALKCLSFDFVGTSLDESSEEFGTVQVPSAWRPMSQQVAKHLYNEKVQPTTLLPKQVGNMYTASLYAAFASLIHEKHSALVAELIGFQRCMHSCLEYLEAVPWVGDEEEEKVLL
ncbi:hypothetical protein Syun_010045 [Stephania yunnanensis]|uniref:Uncharacterized protein n=1 Tax=Stephania yunnanensis TaxID=152371 RepID=A0AAP0PSW6_9MAGN